MGCSGRDSLSTVWAVDIANLNESELKEGVKVSTVLKITEPLNEEVDVHLRHHLVRLAFSVSATTSYTPLFTNNGPF